MGFRVWILEAAATWASVVRGEEAVSRAELLQLATQALPEPPCRENALRVLGTLLRQGRLARVDGGRLGEGTRFGADQ